MKHKWTFVIFISIAFISCNENEKDQGYIQALENSNEFISRHTRNLIFDAGLLSNGDPRPQTLLTMQEINTIKFKTSAFIKIIKNDTIKNTRQIFNQFKKDLIVAYIAPGEIRSFSRSFRNDSLKENENHPLAVINGILLLENELISYKMGSLNASGWRIEKERAIFKIDSNTYFALMSAGPESRTQPIVKLTSVKHGNVNLHPDEYEPQYKSGFFGVILNLKDTTNNRLGDYHIEYELNWNNKTSKINSNFPLSDYFIIEE